MLRDALFVSLSLRIGMSSGSATDLRRRCRSIAAKPARRLHEFVRVEQMQGARDRVVAGRTMTQIQHLAKLVLVTGGEVGDGDAGRLAA
ncbi:hypothetical protein SQ03_28705 [Methylobacterium platani JCM 14648]|uniref:Uncharacterized protein n=2 Tax=Methylobacterium platani TaxID=427683 RepID=A0A179S420_9HYPH|nr:hypothetical protein SQ03_28705 [Methylobacterium platani JCM 14648]OAS20939.1 hypothetical protein A5481_21595 [Methylobacterium platani]